VRFNGACGAGGLRNLLLSGIDANIFKEHLDHSGATMIFGDLLDSS
jgi:hypothetical protein